MITKTKNTVPIKEPIHSGNGHGYIGSGIKAEEELLLTRIRLLAKRRLAWLQKIWQESGAAKKSSAEFNFHAELSGWLCNTDSPETEKAWQEKVPEMQVLHLALKETEKALSLNPDSRLRRLSGLFGLNAVEQNTIEAILALHIDPNLGRIYAYLQDHSGRTYTTRSLVARLFHHTRSLSLGSSSPLFAWQLVTETEMGKGEPAKWELDPFIRNWLLGSNDLDFRLSDYARFLPVHPALESWPLSQTAAWINHSLSKDPSANLRLLITGSPENGRRSFAASLCRLFQLPLLLLQTDGWSGLEWPALFLFAQRQALVLNHAIIWEGRAALEKSWTSGQRQFPLQFCLGEKKDSLIPSERWLDYTAGLPSLSIEESINFWHQWLPGSRNWPEQLLREMMARQRPTIGQLVAAAKKDPQDIPAASEEFQSHARHRMGPLAQILPSSFTWDDLVVPISLRENLNDFYYEATERTKIWEDAAIRRLFPIGRGLIALFSGVPGTGKTMAAQVIAKSLQLDLYRIDLSTIVSKYVGETSKNIERILSCAASMNLVLLFDEADALFGKRTEIKDAHDRFANTDTNFLLQAIEEYPGIAILATNRKSNIDSGFIRRLRFVLDFPKPDTVQRLTIWRKIIHELNHGKISASIDQELKKFSDMLELTGAQIKFSVLSALFMARKDGIPLNITHLIKGVARELLKEGKGIGRQGQEILKAGNALNQKQYAGG